MNSKMNGDITFHKTVYICHHCISHNSINKYDLKKHFEKKKKCIAFNDLSYGEARILSLDKKYIFLFDYSKLTFDDCKYIINHYCYTKNYIYEDFRNMDNKVHHEVKEDKDVKYNGRKSNKEESEEEELKEGEEVKKKKKYKVKRRKQLHP